MLQQMRAFSKSWVSSLFLGILALSFGLWGIADIFRGGSDTNVITVGSTQIEQQTFARDYRLMLRNEAQKTGQEVTPDLARKMGLDKDMVDRTISRTAIDNTVARLGLTVSDADISAKIRAMPVFNGPLGTFDRATFARVLQQHGYTEKDFVDNVRSDTIRAQLVDPVGDAFAIPPGYARAFFAYSTELRATQYVTLSAQSVPAVPPPSDSVLAAYVKAHAAIFSTPEYRSISYAMIGLEDVMPGIKVSDAQLHQAYDDHKAEFVIPEKRDVEQLTFADEASAKTAHDKIVGGMNFDALAKTLGKTPDQLGSVVEADLGARGAPTFAVAQGGVTPPLKNLSGWLLMHVTKITPGSSKSFDQAKPELTEKISRELAQAKLVDIVNAFTDKIGGESELSVAGKKSGMHVGHVAAMDSNGRGPDGRFAGGPIDPQFIAQVFQAEVGDAGDPFQTKDGHYYAIKVEGTIPPKIKALDVVRADATRMWTAEQTAKALKAEATALAAQARREGNLDGIARKIGAPVLSGPSLTRDGANPIFSPELLGAIFAAPPKGIVLGAPTKGDGYIIAQVTGVTHPPIAAADPSYVQGLRGMTGQIAQDLVMSLAKAARDKQGVKINQKLLDQALGGSEGS